MPFEDEENVKIVEHVSLTFEHIEVSQLIVVKKDGTREQFSREKILNGLVRSCEKRPVQISTT